jgi:hypothetical protein
LPGIKFSKLLDSLNSTGGASSFRGAERKEAEKESYGQYPPLALCSIFGETQQEDASEEFFFG